MLMFKKTKGKGKRCNLNSQSGGIRDKGNGKPLYYDLPEFAIKHQRFCARNVFVLDVVMVLTSQVVDLCSASPPAHHSLSSFEASRSETLLPAFVSEPSKPQVPLLRFTMSAKQSTTALSSPGSPSGGRYSHARFKSNTAALLLFSLSSTLARSSLMIAAKSSILTSSNRAGSNVHSPRSLRWASDCESR